MRIWNTSECDAGRDETLDCSVGQGWGLWVFGTVRSARNFGCTGKRRSKEVSYSNGVLTIHAMITAL